MRWPYPYKCKLYSNRLDNSAKRRKGGFTFEAFPDLIQRCSDSNLLVANATEGYRKTIVALKN